MSEYKCNRCEKEFDKYESLSKHVGRIHKIHSIDFLVEYKLNGEWPKCKCDCGQKVKWSYELKSFRDYCQGHQARIVNNWGHNQKAIDKSAETRRQQYASGERKVWNDGLTIEDERVRNNVQNLIELAKSPEERDRRSDRMRKHRLDGTVPTLRGPLHSQWNGGTSSISMLVYNDINFYEKWKRPILIRDGFQCTECGKTKPLHVHHNVEMLCDIIKKYVGNGIDTNNYQLKRNIADAVVDYHIKNKVSGITLCGECHNKIHPFLNFG